MSHSLEMKFCCADKAFSEGFSVLWGHPMINLLGQLHYVFRYAYGTCGVGSIFLPNFSTYLVWSDGVGARSVHIPVLLLLTEECEWTLDLCLLLRRWMVILTTPLCHLQTEVKRQATLNFEWFFCPSELRYCRSNTSPYRIFLLLGKFHNIHMCNTSIRRSVLSSSWTDSGMQSVGEYILYYSGQWTFPRPYIFLLSLVSSSPSVPIVPRDTAQTLATTALIPDEWIWYLERYCTASGQRNTPTSCR